MNRQNIFETLKFNPFDFKSLLLDESNEQDENFFNESHFTDTNYFSTKEAKLRISRSESNSYLLLHLFANLIGFLATLDFESKDICISKKWSSGNLSTVS